MAGNDNNGFFKRWIFTSVAVLAATRIVPGIRSDVWPAIVITALLLGIFNAFLRPALIILTLPIQIVTLGLFTLVINAILLLLAGTLVGPFHVDGFWSAFFGALIISVFGGFLNLVFGGGNRRVAAHVNNGEKQPAPTSPPKENPPPGKGPIIDV